MKRLSEITISSQYYSQKQTSEYIILEYKGEQSVSGVMLMFEDDMLTGRDK